MPAKSATCRENGLVLFTARSIPESRTMSVYRRLIECLRFRESLRLANVGDALRRWSCPNLQRSSLDTRCRVAQVSAVPANPARHGFCFVLSQKLQTPSQKVLCPWQILTIESWQPLCRARVVATTEKLSALMPHFCWTALHPRRSRHQDKASTTFKVMTLLYSTAPILQNNCSDNM